MRQQLKHLAETTPIHGPSHAVEGTIVSSVFWTLSTLLTWIFVLYGSKDMFVQFNSGEVHSTVIPQSVVERGEELSKITYCSDDWIDIQKLNESGLSVHAFAYFMTLMPGMIPRLEEPAPYTLLYDAFDNTVPEEGAIDAIDVLGGGGMLGGRRRRQGEDDRRIHSLFFKTRLGSTGTSGTQKLAEVFAKTNGFDVWTKTNDFDASELEEIVKEFAEFASRHSLETLTDFARYFAVQDVAVGETIETGQSLQHGRYCRQLEINKTEGETSCRQRFESNRIGFTVKYDVTLGLKPYWEGFDGTGKYGKQPHHISISPVVGHGTVSPRVQQQFEHLTLMGETPELVSLTEPVTEAYTLWASLVGRGPNGEQPPIEHYIEAYFSKTTPFIYLSYERSIRIRHRANAGQSPCVPLPEDVELRVPTGFRRWTCMEKCKLPFIEKDLQKKFNCTYVGEYSESLKGVALPCNCEWRVDGGLRGMLGAPDLFACEVVKDMAENCTSADAMALSDCMEKCRDKLPYCSTYENQLNLVEKPMYMSRGQYEVLHVADQDDPSFDVKSGVAVLHIDFDIVSVIEIREYLATTAIDLIIGLGGIAGFFMGVSILSVVHLFIGLVAACFGPIRKVCGPSA